MINKIYEKIKHIIKENISFLVSLVVVFLVFYIELPVVIYTPGGKVDLSSRVEVEGGYKSKGELDLAYVTMVRSSIPNVLLSYVIPNWDLQKISDVVYDDMDMDQTIEVDKISMENGINNAIIAAYNEAHKEVKIKSEKLKVIYVDKNSKSNIEVGDEILFIDNKNVKNIDDIKEIIDEKDINDEIIVKIKRNEKEREIKSNLIEINGEKKLGIATLSIYELDTNPKVKVKSKKSESGSSGGLMTSLAIYNALVKEDITHGDIIIGTGTIDENGNVGDIDGIKYKILGAEKKKAKVFLCPEKNYKEAMKIKKKNKLKIEVKSVKTLKEAIEYLESRK